MQSSLICFLLVFFTIPLVKATDRSLRANVVDCGVDVSKLLPRLSTKVAQIQNSQRFCENCTHIERIDGNVTHVLSGWEEGCRELDAVCGKMEAETCMASVKIIDTQRNSYFYTHHYTPLCRPKSCASQSETFGHALKRYASHEPAELFYFDPKTSSEVAKRCRHSSSCEFIFDICGAEVRMTYEQSKIKSLSNVLSAINNQDKNAPDDVSTDSDGSNSSTSMVLLVAAIGAAVVIATAAFLLFRQRKKELSFVPYE